MMPQQELRLASAHHVLVPGYCLEDVEDNESRLVRARDLVDPFDGAVAERNPVDTSFYNLVFDSHQVLAVNGLPVESFLPTPTSVCTLDDTTREELEAALPVIGEDFGAYPGPEYPTHGSDISLSLQG